MRHVRRVGFALAASRSASLIEPLPNRMRSVIIKICQPNRTVTVYLIRNVGVSSSWLPLCVQGLVR